MDGKCTIWGNNGCKEGSTGLYYAFKHIIIGSFGQNNVP